MVERNYSAAAQPVQQPRPTLLDESLRVNERLEHVHSRIQEISDKMFGTPPREAGVSKEPTPIPNLGLCVDRAHNKLDVIQSELDRISSSL